VEYFEVGRSEHEVGVRGEAESRHCNLQHGELLGGQCMRVAYSLTSPVNDRLSAHDHTQRHIHLLYWTQLLDVNADEHLYNVHQVNHSFEPLNFEVNSLIRQLKGDSPFASS
jgi:hypothetical protein